MCHPSPAPTPHPCPPHPTPPTLGVLGRLRSCIKGPLFKPDRERKSALEVKTEGAGERWRPQGCTSGLLTRLPPASQANADIPALAPTAAEPRLLSSSTPTHTHTHIPSLINRPHQNYRWGGGGKRGRTRRRAQFPGAQTSPPHPPRMSACAPSLGEPNVTTHKMNVSHFLFNSDLPLSPRKTARGGKKSRRRRRGGKKREGGRGGREERKNGGAGGLLLLLSPYLLSHSLYFFSFCFSEGGNDGQSFATSSLQLVRFTRVQEAAVFLGLNAAGPVRLRTGSTVLDLFWGGGLVGGWKGWDEVSRARVRRKESKDQQRRATEMGRFQVFPPFAFCCACQKVGFSGAAAGGGANTLSVF